MEIIISILLGLSVMAILYFSLQENVSLLEERIKKVVKKDKTQKKTIFQNLLEILGQINQNKEINKVQIAKNKLLLMQSGQDSTDESIIIYEGRKLFMFLLVLILSLIFMYFLGFTTMNLAVAILLLLFVYKLPEVILKQKIVARQKEFIKNLPDAIDLLSICIKAGLGLDAALNRVASEFSITSKVVASEFDRLNRDVLSGLTRQEAYRNMSICNPNEEVKSFVALLIQTDKLGTSITQSLDSYCDSVRTRRRQRLEEIAQQAAAKMTIPMVLFMLPAIFIIILYPALIKISANMSF